MIMTVSAYKYDGKLLTEKQLRELGDNRVGEVIDEMCKHVDSFEVTRVKLKFFETFMNDRKKIREVLDFLDSIDEAKANWEERLV